MTTPGLLDGATIRRLLGEVADELAGTPESVLDTFDGPTLQHAIKEMNGERLRQLPRTRAELPDRDLLAERFEAFARAS